MKKRVLCSTFLAVVLAAAPSAAVGAEEQISIVEEISDDNASVSQQSDVDFIGENDTLIVSEEGADQIDVVSVADDSWIDPAAAADDGLIDAATAADDILIDAETATDDGLIDAATAADDTWIDAAAVADDNSNDEAALADDKISADTGLSDSSSTPDAQSASESDPASSVDAADPADDELVIEIEEVDAIEATDTFYASSNATVYSNVSKAIAYVQNQAILRENDISILVTNDVYQKLDLNNATDIIAHTGNPKGGDYLAYSIATLSISAGEQADGNWLVDYYFDYYDTKAQEDAVDSTIQKLVSELNLNSSKSDYEKVKAIYQYITVNVKYDYDTVNQPATHKEKFCAYGSVVDQLAVCQGYSCMFYRLALEAGIDCRIIDSIQLNHTWNIVKLDGKYYLLDPTWDSSNSDLSYFLKGSLDFGDHANTDDNFQDTSFAKTYTLADFQYGSSGLQSLGTAPDYTMITSDYMTISTSAKNNRAKVLVFYFNGCQATQALAKSLSGKTFAGVDIVFANAEQTNAGMVTARSEIGNQFPTGNSIIYTIGSNNVDAMAEFERVAGIADPDGYLYSPTVFIINAKNQIVYASSTAPGNLEEIIQNYLINSSAPSYQADGTGYSSSQKSGICGKNAIWRYSSDGTLEIIGSGALYDNLSTPTNIGWLNTNDIASASYSLDCIYCKDVKKIIVSSGITSIGQNIFASFPNLKTIWFQGNVPTIAGRNTISSSVTIQYPSSDKTWTASVRKKIASKSTWTAVNAKGRSASESCTAPKKTSISSLTNMSKGVKITWKKSSKASGYYIYRGNTKIATISSASTLTYTDTKAKTNNKKYTYKVVAFTKSGSTIAKAAASAAKSCYYVSVPTCSSVKNTAKQAMTVKWKKNSKATGYEIQYSQSKTFASGNKTVTIKKASTLSTVIKKLTRKKTYYVRIRAYKTAGGTKYYSAWCTAKSVKIKK
jgi:hypothetical protein